jgi:hypothetical protein
MVIKEYTLSDLAQFVRSSIQLRQFLLCSRLHYSRGPITTVSCSRALSPRNLGPGVQILELKFAIVKPRASGKEIERKRAVVADGQKFQAP